jgi:hypothetical protein
MKEFIIAVLATLSSFISQAMYTIEESVQQLLPQIQQTITENEPYIQQFKDNLLKQAQVLGFLPADQATELKEQLSEVIHDISVNPAFIQEALGIRKLAPVKGTDSYQASGRMQIIAGDTGVSHATLVSTAHLVEDVSLPVLKEKLGAVPTKHVRIVMFSTPHSYGQALQQAGIPAGQVNQIVKVTGGLAIQSEIWIPLYAVHGKSEQANVLTHELTHVAFNQQGIGSKLPLWINEGMSWHTGMAGKKRISPKAEKRMRTKLNEQIQAVVAANQLLPLTADGNDIIHASYNVEWQDYMAVHDLIETYGEDKMREFLINVKKLGVEASFLQAFGMPLHTFEEKFYKSIQ